MLQKLILEVNSGLCLYSLATTMYCQKIIFPFPLDPGPYMQLFTRLSCVLIGMWKTDF